MRRTISRAYFASWLMRAEGTARRIVVRRAGSKARKSPSDCSQQMGFGLRGHGSKAGNHGKRFVVMRTRGIVFSRHPAASRGLRRWTGGMRIEFSGVFQPIRRANSYCVIYQSGKLNRGATERGLSKSATREGRAESLFWRIQSATEIAPSGAWCPPPALLDIALLRISVRFGRLTNPARFRLTSPQSTVIPSAAGGCKR